MQQARRDWRVATQPSRQAIRRAARQGKRDFNEAEQRVQQVTGALLSQLGQIPGAYTGQTAGIIPNVTSSIGALGGMLNSTIGQTPVAEQQAGANLIGTIGDTVWMLDVKTSKGVYGSIALQTHAYANAEFYVNDDDPDTEHPLPEGIERYGVLHVTEYGTELRPLDSTASPFRIFTHIAYVAKCRESIDLMITDAVTDLENL